MPLKTNLIKDELGVTHTSTYEIRDHIDHHPSTVMKIAGIIFDFYGNVAPVDSLPCNGQEVSKTVYPLLYAAIGDLWAITGGVTAPGSGNFRLPPQEKDNFGLFFRGKGGSIGEYQEDVIKEHNHTINHNHGASSQSSGRHSHSVKAQHDSALGTKSGSISSVPNYHYETNPAGEHSHNIGINSFNGDSQKNNSEVEIKPKSITVLKCIWIGE